MLATEWKQTMCEKCEDVSNVAKAMVDHINMLDHIENKESIDMDEMAAFLEIKLRRLNQALKQIS